MTLPIDEGVGQIRRKLVELGIEKDTLVMFFSDNGASSDFPSGSPAWRENKGAVYEGGHKVPCIGWWPGRIAAGSVSAAPAMTIDVMPTILALAGVEAPADRPLDGADLSPVLLGKGTLAERPLYWASLGNNGSRAEAMREGGWKVVVQHPGAAPGSFDNPVVELFHLSEDPEEKRDLAAENAELAGRMAERLRDWYGEVALSAMVKLEGPAGKWEQAGLLVCGNLANFVKLVVEHIDGEFFVVMAEEYNGKRKVLAKLPIAERGARLKLVVEGNRVVGCWKGGKGLTAESAESAEREEDKEKENEDGWWVEAGRSVFPARVGAMRRWGLFTQDGLSDEKRWASFRDVRY